MPVNSLGVILETTTRVASPPKKCEPTVASKYYFVTCYVVSHTILGFLTSFILSCTFYAIMLIPLFTTITTVSIYSFSFIILSPWMTSIISPIMIPITLSESKQSIIPPAYVDRYEKYLIFLKSKRWTRFAVVRHFLIGTYLAVFFIPFGIVVVLFVLNSVLSVLAFVFFAGLYISLISAFAIPLSILSFSVRSHHERVMYYMQSKSKSSMKKWLYRILYCPMC